MGKGCESHPFLFCPSLRPEEETAVLGACLQNLSRPNCTIGGCGSHLPHGVLEPPLNLAGAKSLERLAALAALAAWQPWQACIVPSTSRNSDRCKGFCCRSALDAMGQGSSQLWVPLAEELLADLSLYTLEVQLHRNCKRCQRKEMKRDKLWKNIVKTCKMQSFRRHRPHPGVRQAAHASDGP